MTESTRDVAGPTQRGHSRLHRSLRIAIPIAVSVLLFLYLFSRIDVRAVADSISLPIVLRWLLPLLLFNVVTLTIEAHCLHRVASVAGVQLDRWTAARIKAACYLLGILNYALGAAGLSVLLRRRARLPLAESASMVFLISLFDIGAVLFLAAGGALFLEAELEADALGIRFGLIGVMIGAIVAGFVFLRAPIHLGPLDRLRRLDVFKAPRTAPLALLLELAILRIVFVGCFVGLMAALFWAFGIEVGLLRVGLNTAIMLVVSALPIAAGGLGTGQLVFVELFRDFAPAAELLAASLVSSQ